MKESIGMNKSKTSNISYLDEKEKRKLQFMDSKIMDRKVDRVLKCIFFSVICVVFILTCVASFTIIYHISGKTEVSITDVGIILGGFGSVIGDIIVLPKIVAKHLFPENIKQNSSEDTYFKEAES